MMPSGAAASCKRIEASTIRSLGRAPSQREMSPTLRRIRWIGGVLARIGAASAGAVAARAEDPEIASRRAIERKTFTDAEIIDGFFKVTFGAEFHVAGRVDRIRKYDVPVRVFIDSRAQPDRSQQVAAVVADIRKRIRNLDIAGDRQPRATPTWW